MINLDQLKSIFNILPTKCKFLAVQRFEHTSEINVTKHEGRFGIDI